jgi:hypothetical protein
MVTWNGKAHQTLMCFSLIVESLVEAGVHAQLACWVNECFCNPEETHAMSNKQMQCK